MTIIRVADITLFHVAAQQLGDATQWNRIAALNSLSDPMLHGVTVLSLPPLDTGLGGGLPSQ
ncbi:hypothetical protein [Lichenicoccus roseus]|uniref:LysM domain-containing protein n=1 Tax=Lichenicoccus roseus TaxID=2683649 RepID=A0A5R9J6T5_9PROT|nr:hypothetical protein [Lichenicoccus roseus]TLU72679.1 hypothetical protein FE263_11645 [Lichenicoccus roseus]